MPEPITPAAPGTTPWGLPSLEVDTIPVDNSLYVTRLQNGTWVVQEPDADGRPRGTVLTQPFSDVQQASRAARALMGSPAQGAQEARLASLESIIPAGARGQLVDEINMMLQDMGVLVEQSRNYGTAISRIGADISGVTAQVQQANNQIATARADLAKEVKGDQLGKILGGIALAVASYALFLSLSDG